MKKLFLMLILLFALSLGGTLLYFNLTEPKEIPIPDLRGKTAEEAKNIFKRIERKKQWK